MLPLACAGRWRGTPVAVKVIQTTVVPEARVDLNHESMLRCALLTDQAEGCDFKGSSSYAQRRPVTAGIGMASACLAVSAVFVC